MLDQSYRVIHRIRVGQRLQARPARVRDHAGRQGAVHHLPDRARGPEGGQGRAHAACVVDSVIQEVDIATGLVTFEWHSLGKIPLTRRRSRGRAPSPRVPFDYAHANSVNLDTDGNLLLSARNTWTVYKIDHDTGRIMWRLGGKHSNFKLAAAARFAWQHDVLRARDGAITVFDNSASRPCASSRARSAIRLDETAKTASLISRARRTRSKLLTATQGNQQTLPNGDFAGRLGLAAAADRVRARPATRLQRVPVARLRDLPRLPAAVGRASR